MSQKNSQELVKYFRGFLKKPSSKTVEDYRKDIPEEEDWERIIPLEFYTDEDNEEKLPQSEVVTPEQYRFMNKMSAKYGKDSHLADYTKNEFSAYTKPKSR